MKTYIADIPRSIIQADALDTDEFKTYALSEVGKLLDSPAVAIQDITGKTMPSSAEARVSKSKDLDVKLVNMRDIGVNITKATGAVTFLGVGDTDVVFNVDACKTLSLSDESAMIGKSGFLSFSKYLSNLSLVEMKAK
jgi:hypothetical protein